MQCTWSSSSPALRTAPVLQPPAVTSWLGLGQIPAFDLNAVCSGFLYGLATAVGMLTFRQFGTVLLIAAEPFSRLIDDDDRATAFLFGDGAGAVALRHGEPCEHGAVLGVNIGSDGTEGD